MSRITYQLALIAALAVGAFYAVSYFTGEEGGGGGQRRPGPVVGVSIAAPQTFVQTIEAIGDARANESVTLMAKVTDTIRAIAFTDGQLVEEGDVVVELASAEQGADLIAARAQLAEAQANYERAQDLVRRGSASQARLDEATAARDAARGRVRALEARLGDRVIRAPFAGVLGLRMVSPGELVRPGDPIVTLDDVSVIKADFPVPERYVPLLRNGLQIEAFASAWPERGFSGTVTSVSTRVDVATRSVTVRAEIPNPEGLLRPGMLLAITLTTENRTALAVPETAIVPVGDVRYVFVIGEDLKAARVEVRTGNRYAGFVEILSGIEAGATVVSEGTHKVIPGLAVQLPAAADAASGGAGSGGGGAP